MEQKQPIQYTGTVWSSEQKQGTAYRISIDFDKIKDINPDSYGNILFSISKRKEQHPKNKATHNIYLCSDPHNYLSDRFALLNLSLNKQQLSELKNEGGYSDIIAFPLSKESIQKDKSKATHFVTNNLAKQEERLDNSKRISIGKAWNIYHKKEKISAEKLYLGNAFINEVDGVQYINAGIEREKVAKIEPFPNNNVYLNLAHKKDKENELSVYFSPSKQDNWAFLTIALNKERLLSITPTDKGYIPISISYKKEQSIGDDNANINVKANSLSPGYDSGDYPDGMSPELYDLEEKQEKEDFYIGKGWTKENMYWLTKVDTIKTERTEEVDQTITIEKGKEMEGKGLTNKGLHIFQTVKVAPNNQDNLPDTSNSYYLKDGLVYHEKQENSILPTNGFKFSEFVLNYEILKKNYDSSTFYNIEFLGENEKDIFIKNSPERNDDILGEKKNPSMSNKTQIVQDILSEQEIPLPGKAQKI